ncbi:MAG: outer membrane protein [Glomeribacter sp. 1016415]|nr:outer membrane protein [Glomeribacter sp. 1016415]
MKLIRIFAACAALLGAAAAHAQTAGSFILGTGWLHLNTHDSSDPMRMTSPKYQVHNNTGSSVNNANTLGLSGNYFFTDNIAGEFVVGIPPRFSLNGEGEYAQYGELGSVRQWSPALLLKYYFFNAQTKFRPYAGLGISRVWFTDAKLTNDRFTREKLLSNSAEVSAENRWSPVFNAGFSYQLTERWYAGLSVSYLPLRTTAKINSTVKTPEGLIRVTNEAKIRINPIITYLNIGYRF